MEIPEQLMKFKFHLIFGVLFSASIYAMISISPRFIDLLAYFWPLLASTALFLAVVVVFSRVSPPATDVPGEKAAEGLLDYVAGQPEIVGDSFRHE
ncbi:ABC transporter G family member 5 [Bienertia sinuspersici]